jgi:hypothetical protein
MDAMQNNNTLKYFLAIAGVAILLAVGLSFLNKDSAGGSTKYDALASCIAQKGVKFFGAFWCPHCAEQKKMFGASQRLLPYVECSTPDTQGQTPICIEKKIESYPTWEFADGSRQSAVLTPAKLAELTSCEAALPADEQGAESATSSDTGTSAAATGTLNVNLK